MRDIDDGRFDTGMIFCLSNNDR